jgi:hypothetical protein
VSFLVNLDKFTNFTNLGCVELKRLTFFFLECGSGTFVSDLAGKSHCVRGSFKHPIEALTTNDL